VIRANGVLQEPIVLGGDEHTHKAAALAAAIIHMGHALGQQVIAEGVETVEQATRPQELDCDIAQGYYFAKPMEPEAFTVLLEERGGPGWPVLSSAPALALQPTCD
jgi:EAL domain-containing protein (putative c-di-GMP-specific phosphodiesterase class I)